MRGAILRVSGITDYYQGRFSPKLQAAEVMEAQEAEDEGLLHRLLKFHQKAS